MSESAPSWTDELSRKTRLLTRSVAEVAGLVSGWFTLPRQPGTNLRLLEQSFHASDARRC